MLFQPQNTAQCSKVQSTCSGGVQRIVCQASVAQLQTSECALAGPQPAELLNMNTPDIGHWLVIISCTRALINIIMRN